MCLYTTQEKVKILQAPILAYKVLLKTPIAIVSPFQFYPYTEYAVSHEIIECKDKLEAIEIKDPRIKGYDVTHGFHLFLDIDRAKSLKRWNVSHIIYECEIPEGASCYIGWDGKEICVNRFRILRRAGA